MLYFFSNSFSAYSKLTLEEIGYFKSGLIFGEDTLAAAEILLKKKKIAYTAEAKAFHSHNYEIRQDFMRYFDMGVFHKNEYRLLKTFGKPESQAMKYIKSEFPWQVTFNDPALIPDRTIIFHVGAKERLKITKDGFYVDGRLVANDTEIYQAFKDFLNSFSGMNSFSGKETQDDRYYKAIKRNIEKENKDGR